MSESYLDRPQDDFTPKAHPAWKRGYNHGKIAGVKTMIKIIEDIVSGADNGTGRNNTPEIESVRRAVLEYREALKDKSLESKTAKKVLKDAKTKLQK